MPPYRFQFKASSSISVRFRGSNICCRDSRFEIAENHAFELEFFASHQVWTGAAAWPSRLRLDMRSAGFKPPLLLLPRRSKPKFFASSVWNRTLNRSDGRARFRTWFPLRIFPPFSHGKTRKRPLKVTFSNDVSNAIKVQVFGKSLPDQHPSGSGLI